TQDTVSIFALTVHDAAKVAPTAIAYDVADAYARSEAQGFNVASLPVPLKVGVPSDPISFFGDDAYETLYRAAIERMRALGAEIVQIDFAPFAAAADMLYTGPWLAERLVATGWLLKQDPIAVHPVLRDILRGAEGKTALQAFQTFYALAGTIRDAA